MPPNDKINTFTTKNVAIDLLWNQLNS
jgi:hypothetical protein